mgnify:CR=1 FL=1
MHVFGDGPAHGPHGERREDGVEVRIDPDGQILLRAPMLLRCYRDGTVPSNAEGWLATGQNELPGGYSVKGGMPPWAASLNPDEIMAVVLHERSELDDKEFDIAQWEDGFEETLQEYVPDDAAAYMAVLEEWKASPPA